MGDHTRGTLLGVVQGYGEIEECTVVIDKNTGKAKGSRRGKGLKRLLRSLRKGLILNTTATCQTGPGFGSTDNQGLSAVARATYVYPVYVREPIPSCLWRWNYKESSIGSSRWRLHASHVG